MDLSALLAGEGDKRSEELLEEIAKNREELYELISKVKDVRDRVETILPERVDYRNRHIFAERVKSIAQIVGTELELRKQIDSSVRLEFELRRKLYGLDDEGGDTSKLVKVLAEALEMVEDGELNDDESENEPGGFLSKDDLEMIEENLKEERDNERD